MQETHVVLAVRVNSEGSTPSSSVADSGRSLVLAWFFGDVAQLVARLLCKQMVAGSSPVFSTTFR